MNLVPHGLTPRQYGARAMWARRRDKYGRSGYTADGLERMVAMKRGRNQHTGRTHCKRGHKFRPGSYYVHGTSRQCKPCMAVTQGQRAWSRHSEAKRAERTEAARVAMIQSGVKMNQQPESAYWRNRAVAARERWLSLKQRRAA